MDNKQIDRLLDKLQSGDFNAADEQYVRAFIHDFNKEGDSGLKEADFAEAKEEMWKSIVLQTGRPKKTRKLPAYLISAAAAIAVIVFGAGLFYFNSVTRKDGANPAGRTAVIVPGKSGATLTLANGKVIRLNDVGQGELATEAGVSIKKTASGELVYEVKGTASDLDQMNTLSTARGETFHVRLPDNSLVQLNAASSLTYSAKLTEGGKRVVSLSGEAYFEIAKDKAHPFVVRTGGGQEVEVLGTHFNVSAYEEEPLVKTTLLEGSVKINRESKEGGSLLLKPGQQSSCDGTAIKVLDVDVEREVAWKNGRFVFGGQDFRSAMRAIARWYDIEVVYDYEPANLEIGGTLLRSRNITEVLKVLQATGDVNFKIEGRRVHVIK
ncbi:FecR family protein [Pedobacter sp. AW31-3R]|uniref:FecR family protein n=1 Tax=Pedobacter sp. AW31-3R TaxID=3445781 RepID=UPI003FA0A060